MSELSRSCLPPSLASRWAQTFLIRSFAHGRDGWRWAGGTANCKYCGTTFLGPGVVKIEGSKKHAFCKSKGIDISTIDGYMDHHSMTVQIRKCRVRGVKSRLSLDNMPLIHNPVYSRSVEPSDLSFSLSSHRHSYNKIHDTHISLQCNSRFITSKSTKSLSNSYITHELTNEN
jgi:hypothetical protein